MKKIVLVLMMLVTFLTMNVSVASASIIEGKHSLANNNNVGYNTNFMQGQNIGASDCGGIFTPDALEIIKEVLGWFRILAPCVLIIMIAVDQGKAVMAQDDKGIKEATQRTIKRSIACLCVVLVPTFVRFLLNLDGVKNAITISDDPMCGTLQGEIDKNTLLVE